MLCEPASSTVLCLHKSPASLQPEKRLMLAVLEQAVLTFQRYAVRADHRGGRLFREIVAWFDSNDAGSPFCFLPICQALGLDEEYLRQGLRRWRERTATVIRLRATLAAVPPRPRLAQLPHLGRPTRRRLPAS